MNTITISKDNYHDLVRIYEEGIATGLATFETTAPTWESWDQAHLGFGRVLAYNDQIALGWAALSPVSSRCVYGGVAEVSVYVAAAARGLGVGQFLLNQLIEISEANGIWTLQAGVFDDNLASRKLHLKCGFREIGYREKIGKLHGVWKNNILFERRSLVIGV